MGNLQYLTVTGIQIVKPNVTLCSSLIAKLCSFFK